MHFKILVISLLLFISAFASEQGHDSLVQPLASLTYHVRDLKDHLDHQDERDNPIAFEEDDVSHLWDRAQRHASQLTADQAAKLVCARRNYAKAQRLIQCQQVDEARFLLQESADHLEALRTHFINTLFEEPDCIFRKNMPLDETSHLPKKVRKAITPYLIANDHPMKARLDAIFKHTRASMNEKTFANAGFVTLGTTRPRTFMRVARHPDLPGHLVKVSLDNELRQKRDKPSWKWLVYRCKGAAKIRKVIHDRNFKHFTVPDKYIYPLPSTPLPPLSAKYTKHLAILLVTDMQLTPEDVNHHAWYHYITKEHLDELYTIISWAKGSSYRPDNIAFTWNGTFAFIDTEYPDGGPDYKRIRKYLRPEMLTYWDRLVRRGGK